MLSLFRLLNTTGQTGIEFDAQEPEPMPAQPALAADTVTEAAPGFSIAPGWIDTKDRTQTWNLLDASGGKLAEICTKRDAQKLADILNRVRDANTGRSR